MVNPGTDACPAAHANLPSGLHYSVTAHEYSYIRRLPPVQRRDTSHGLPGNGPEPVAKGNEIAGLLPVSR